MSLRALIGLALLLLGPFTLPSLANAQAAYTVEVAVADRSPAEQEAANRIAMRQVLLDNAGDKTLLNRTDVRNALADAKTYVVQFSYRAPLQGEVIPATMAVTDLVRTSGEATHIMKVRFDRDRITEVIKGRPQGRPQSSASASSQAVQFQSALVWMVIRDNGTDLLMSGGNGTKVMQRSREIAGGKGVVLSFPAGDATDVAALGGEPYTLTPDVVLPASLRYVAPAIITADIRRKQPVGWMGDWQRLVDDQVATESFEANTLDELLSLGLSWMAPQQSSDVVASAIASPSAPLASESTIWFNGVQSTQDYAQLMKTMSDIGGVRSVYAKELREQGIVIAIQPSIALGQVRARLAQMSRLRETAAPVFNDRSRLSVDAAYEFAR